MVSTGTQAAAVKCGGCHAQVKAVSVPQALENTTSGGQPCCNGDANHNCAGLPHRVKPSQAEPANVNGDGTVDIQK